MATAQVDDGSVLPFPPLQMESVAKPRLQDSKMQWPKQPRRLPADAPNILVILIDDVGFGVADTFGGEVHTPALTRLASEGIRYNAFHTTAICSPTRASLLTGRNHTRIGSGTIAERAVAFDVGIDLGSPVSSDYYVRRPFQFTGKIEQVTVQYVSGK